MTRGGIHLCENCLSVGTWAVSACERAERWEPDDREREERERYERMAPTGEEEA